MENQLNKQKYFHQENVKMSIVLDNYCIKPEGYIEGSIILTPILKGDIKLKEPKILLTLIQYEFFDYINKEKELSNKQKENNKQHKEIIFNKEAKIEIENNILSCTLKIPIKVSIPKNDKLLPTFNYKNKDFISGIRHIFTVNIPEINAINSIVMNYGIAIIIMTILLRLLMWPLTRKSYTSMAAMQKMQPEMQRIQKLYANDKQRMQIEIMKLYQTHKTSPMSGCLPMLIQIPIFFALYKALLISVQMRNAHFLWISDLAVMDPYFILPILMGASMWLQQRLQSGALKSADKNDVAAQTQRAMRWMPIIFTVMFAWMPAGLVLYWTVSNLFGILQMYIIKRNMK